LDLFYLKCLVEYYNKLNLHQLFKQTNTIRTMGIRDMIDNMKERSRERKEKFKQADEQLRIEELLTERRKSANERELNRFLNEDREESIKFELEKMRKLRENDIRFNHNPLNVPNVTNHTDFEVLKQKNLFKGKSNMFSNQEFIFKNNPKLLKNNMKLLRS